MFEGNPFQPSVAFHIETSQLICTANQMNGFFMECNTGLKWVDKKRNIIDIRILFGISGLKFLYCFREQCKLNEWFLHEMQHWAEMSFK